MTTRTPTYNPRLVAVAAVCIAALALVACGDDDDGADEGGGSTAASSEALSDPKLPPPPENIEGADVKGAQEMQLDGFESAEFIPPGEAFDVSEVTKPVWLITVPSTFEAVDGINRGFEEAAQAAGVEHNICQGESKPDRIAICLQQAVAAGAGSVIELGMDPTIIAKPLAEAREAGVKVVTGNTALRVGDPLPENVDGQVTHDYYGTGELGAAYAIAERGSSLNALCLVVPEFGVTQSVCEGFTDTVEELCTDCQVETQEVHIDQLETQTTAIVNQEILQNSDLNFIMGSLDDLAPIIGPVLQRAGKSPDDITVGGQNGTVGALTAIQEGGDYQKFSGGQHNLWWGWAVFDAAARAQVQEMPEALQTEPNVAFTPETFDYEGEISLDAADEIYGLGDGAVYRDGYQSQWGGS